MPDMRRALAVITLLAVMGCSAEESPDTESVPSAPSAKPASPSPSVGKYEQTWTKGYGKTTCKHWNNQMDEHQQFVAAADMLVNVQTVDDPDLDDMPSDAKIREFAGGITTACVVPTYSIAEIAVGVYMTDQDLFAPK